MSERRYIGKSIKMKFSGIFDFADLYRKMKYWLDFNGYGDETKNFKEIKYVERIKPEGKQLEIAWEARKPINDYLVNVLEVTFFIVGLQKVEIERDGKKIGTNKGDIEFRFSGYLLVNANDGYKDDYFVNRIYKNYIIKDRIEQYMIDLYNKLYSFIDEVKGYLDLQKF